MRRLIDADRQREAARQNRLLAAADNKFGKRLANEIRRSMLKMLAQYKLTGGPPNVPEDHEREVRNEFMRLAVTMSKAFGERILDQGKALGYSLERKDGWAEFFERVALGWISQEAVRGRIVDITNTTRKNIISRIDIGQRDGLGVDDIARDIAKRIPSLSRDRGALIARTETHGAANFAANETVKSTGLKVRKEWVSVSDGRTRTISDGAEYDHAAMDGDVVDMDQPFKMPAASGGSLLIMYPGESGLPGGATINCRCAVSHIIED